MADSPNMDIRRMLLYLRVGEAAQENDGATAGLCRPAASDSRQMLDHLTNSIFALSCSY